MKQHSNAPIDGYNAFKGLLFAPGCSKALKLLELYLIDYQETPALQKLIKENESKAETLEYEFNRLCVGPYKIPVPPYESVFVSGRRQLLTDETSDVIDAYQEVGLMANPTWGEPADYIGTELEFMSYMESLLLNPNCDGFQKPPLVLRQLADDFLIEHLGKWYQEFTQQIIQHSQHPFWAQYATALCHFLDIQIQVATERQQSAMTEESRYELN